MKINYQRELEQLVNENTVANRVPRLLLHSCCGPCSSYVLEYLAQHFEITVHYYNPNIFPAAEYHKRAAEQKALIDKIEAVYTISFREGEYDHPHFLSVVNGLEQEPEGGERCFKCYELRLREAAKEAKKGGYDYFATTLTISPLKKADKLNEIGERIGQEYGVAHLPSDFKKRGGYQRSIALSKIYGLYRQDYCGCEFSRR